MTAGQLLIFSSPKLTCELKRRQCQYIRADGTQCGTLIRKGHPYCPFHTRKVWQVRMDTVDDEDAIFAEKSFKCGEWIVPFIGEHINGDCVMRRYVNGPITAPYLVEDRQGPPLPSFIDDLVKENICEFTGGSYVDAACLRGIGAMARVKPFVSPDVNVEIVRRRWHTPISWMDDSLWLRATKNIEKGEEIFRRGHPNLHVFHKTYKKKEWLCGLNVPC